MFHLYWWVYNYCSNTRNPVSRKIAAMVANPSSLSVNGAKGGDLVDSRSNTASHGDLWGRQDSIYLSVPAQSSRGPGLSQNKCWTSIRQPRRLKQKRYFSHHHAIIKRRSTNKPASTYGDLIFCVHNNSLLPGVCPDQMMILIITSFSHRPNGLKLSL